MTYEREEWVLESVKSLARIYDLGFDSRGVTRSDVDAVTLWLLVLEHVMALGGLAVRLEKWTLVRTLALTKGTGKDFDYYPTWLRHALTMAARANRLVEAQPDGQRIQVSLISLAATKVVALRCLRPDVEEQDERVLN